mmetsp:Transcript_6603/g.26574  ORF Transcript_6603/g.26574 Transcript_6603/m.26574 type:complete len:201 (+) Transcript_6603:605-1207(+)
MYRPHGEKCAPISLHSTVCGNTNGSSSRGLSSISPSSSNCVSNSQSLSLTIHGKSGDAIVDALAAATIGAVCCGICCGIPPALASGCKRRAPRASSPSSFRSSCAARMGALVIRPIICVMEYVAYLRFPNPNISCTYFRVASGAFSTFAGAFARSRHIASPWALRLRRRPLVAVPSSSSVSNLDRAVSTTSSRAQYTPAS